METIPTLLVKSTMSLESRSSSPTNTPLMTTTPLPQLPIDILHQIYANFDALGNEEDRDTLAHSLKASKTLHSVATRPLYREVALHWLVNKGYKWWGTDSGPLPHLSRARKDADSIPLRYRRRIRYLCVHDHLHDKLSHPPLSASRKITVVDILEIKMRMRGRHPWNREEKVTDKWCNPCEPGQLWSHRHRLTKCFALTPFRANTLIIDCPAFFSEVSRGGLFGVPRFPDSTFSQTRRVVIRPYLCTRKPLSRESRIRLGYIPAKVERIDILFEPGFWRRSRRQLPSEGWVQVDHRLECRLLEELSTFLQESRVLVPESCVFYLVNVGTMDSSSEPYYAGTQVKRPNYEERQTKQDDIKSRIKQLAIRKYGDTPEITKTMDRLRFQTLQQYAGALKGLNRRLISQQGWDALHEGLSENDFH